MFLVKWHGGFDSDATWINGDEFQTLSPSLLDSYWQFNSQELSSSQSRGNDTRPFNRGFSLLHVSIVASYLGNLLSSIILFVRKFELVYYS